MTRVFILSLALLVCFVGPSRTADRPCTSLVSVFNLTEWKSSPTGELSTHILLWLNRSDQL